VFDPDVALPSWLMWAVSRKFWHVLAWVLAVSLAGWRLDHARNEFANKSAWPAARYRADGNRGHTFIDFGGQWVMGRMLVTGHGRELFDRTVQWQVVRAAFPRTDESPNQRAATTPGMPIPSEADIEEREHDAEKLMRCFMGTDWDEWPAMARAISAPFAQIGPGGNPFVVAIELKNAEVNFPPETTANASKKYVGGPLYPPVHAFFYAPLGLLNPLDAYYVFQVIAVGFGFLAGAGASYGTRGKVWWPLAASLFFLMPGCRAGLDLGQNPLVTAAIVTWGWAFSARGRHGLGGAAWGLLAFKPVWGLAFVLVPILGRRWRFVFVMCTTGVGLAAATVPVVGIQTWKDWLAVGASAAANYNTSESWNHLSRDTQGIVRRLALDYSKPQDDRNVPWVNTLCWTILIATVLTTAVIFTTCANRKKTWGLGAAFAFFGAYLSCYRFMYYDALLMGIGWICLFTDRSGWQSPAASLNRLVTNFVESVPVLILATVLFVENVVFTWVVKATAVAEGFGSRKIRFEIGHEYAWDTILTLLIWLWCGWRLLLGDDWTAQSGEGGPDVGRPHEGFADQNRVNARSA
jgi:hypothetical protein